MAVAYRRRQTIRLPRTMKNKLNAHKVEYDGFTFGSKKEAIRWAELKLEAKAGRITDLERQVPFELIPAQYEEIPTGEFYKKGEKKGQPKFKRVCIEKAVTYVADFVYIENGKKVVEDTKGCKEGITYNYFVLKRKLMLYVHGIRIKEV
jgi:hypothetical protein